MFLFTVNTARYNIITQLNTMFNLRKIQTIITINNIKIVTFVDFKVIKNVISVKFITKHKLKTKTKQLVLKLYSFNKIRIKKNVIQKLSTMIKIKEKFINVIFDIVDYVKEIFLKYS